MQTSQAQHLDKSREEIRRLKQVCLNQRGVKALNLETEVTGDYQAEIESERQQDLTAEFRDHCRELKQKFTSAKKVREKQLDRDRRRVMQQQDFCDKENFIGEEDSSLASYRNLPAAYRKAQDAGKSVERFKQKYQKLEENFKKFTSKLNENQKRSSSHCRVTPNTSIAQQRVYGGVNSSMMQPEISPIRANFHLNPSVQNPNLSFQRASLKHQHVSMVQDAFSGQNILNYPGQKTILGETAQVNLESEESIEPAHENPFRNYENMSYKRQPLQELPQDQNPQGRAQLLTQVLLRFESNLKAYFSSLSALTVSKQQEQDIQELYQVFQAQVQKVKRVNPMRIEQDQVIEVFQTVFAEIQRCLNLLIQNIYSVQSETFKSYKFKEVYKLFESLSYELFNYGQLDFYPTLLKMKLQTGNTMLNHLIKKKDGESVKRQLQIWKQNTGFLYYQKKKSLQSIAARRAVNILVSNQKLRVNKKFLIWTAKSKNQVVGQPVREDGTLETLLNQFLDQSVLSQKELHSALKQILKPYCSEMHLITKNREDPGKYCDENLVQYKTEEILKSKSILSYSFTQPEPVFISDIKGNKKFEQTFDLPTEEKVLKVFREEQGFISYFSAQFLDEQAQRQFVLKAYSLSKIATEAQRREITVVLQQVKVFLKLVLKLRKEKNKRDQEKKEIDIELQRLQEEIEVYSFVTNIDKDDIITSFNKQNISLVIFQTPQEEKEEESRYFEVNYKEYRFLFKEEPDQITKRKTIAFIDQVMLKVQEPIQDLQNQLQVVKQQQIQKQKIQDQVKEVGVLVKAAFMNWQEVDRVAIFKILEDKEIDVSQNFMVNTQTKKVETEYREFLLNWAKEEAQVREEKDGSFTLSSFFPKTCLTVQKDQILCQTLFLNSLLVFSVKKPACQPVLEQFIQVVKQESDWALRLQGSETLLQNLETKLKQTITQAQEQNEDQKEIVTCLVQPLLKNLTQETLVKQTQKLFMRILGTEEVQVEFMFQDQEAKREENVLLTVCSGSVRDRKKLKLQIIAKAQVEEEILENIKSVLRTCLTLLSMQDKTSVSVKQAVLPRSLLRIEQASRQRNLSFFFLKLAQIQKHLMSQLSTRAAEDCNIEEKIELSLKYDKVLKKLTNGFKKQLKVYFDKFVAEDNKFLSYTKVTVEHKQASSSLDKCLKNQLTRQSFYYLAHHARKEKSLKQANQLWIFSFVKLSKVEDRFIQRAALKSIDNKIKAQSSYQREKEDLQRKLEKENQMKQALKQLEQSQNLHKEMQKDFQFSLDLQEIQSSFPQDSPIEHNLKILANHLAHYLFLSGKNLKADLVVLTHRVQENKKLRQLSFGREMIQLAKEQELRVEERHGQKHQVIDSESTVKQIVTKQPNLDLYTETWISEHRDIITSMLKRTQAVLTLSDIKHSLYDLYSQHPQSKVQSRLNQISQFKSATVFPLLCPQTNQVVASLELFSTEQQEENQTQQNMTSIVKAFEQTVNACYKQEQQRKEIEKIVVETEREKEIRDNQVLNAPQNLSQFLRSLYFQCPEQLQAQHVLPILLVPQSEQAYFYLFKDNHIYNFDSQETFVQEIVEKGCILELEATFEGSPIRSSQRSLQSYKTSQSVKRILESVKTVTNEEFEHIVYYPIFDRKNNVRAILEVAYSKKEFVPENIVTQKVSQLLQKLQIQLETFTQQLNSFTKTTKAILKERERQSRIKAFQRWKFKTQIQKEKEIQKQKEIQTISETEQQYQKYLKSIDHYDEELKQAVTEKETLNQHIKLLRVEKKAKLKFLATALIYASIQEKAQSQLKMKNLFNQWKQKVTSLKIAETAFNQILEHNHKHSDARFDTGCYLIERMFFSQAQNQLKSCFDEIQMHAEEQKIQYQGNQALRNDSFMQQDYESQLLRENSFQMREDSLFVSKPKTKKSGQKSRSKTPVKTPQKQLKNMNQTKQSQILTTYGSNYSVVHQS